MKRKAINEHYFDEESKEMWYVLGVSFSRYSASKKDNRNSWRSSSYDLLEIVQRQLDTEQSIGEPNEIGGRLFQVRSQYLQDKLKEKGLGVSKSEREFPEDCEEQYLDHFIRGFFDGNISVSTNNFTAISFPSIPFLHDLYQMLVFHASVRNGREVTKSPLNLSGQDTIAVHDFIYRDWDFIQEHGLYLPSKKERFKT